MINHKDGQSRRYRGAAMTLLLVACSAATAANISGTISSNTTLLAANSPYTMTGPVTIKAGVTLTVEPGVQVIAQGKYSLQVNGTLEASGLATSRVTFRSAAGNDKGGWAGIAVNPGGVCTLTHTVIRNGQTNLTLTGGKTTLTNCLVLMASDNGVMGYGSAEFNASGCEFANANQRGVYLEGYQAKGIVTDCLFRTNGDYPVLIKAPLVRMLGAKNLYRGNRIQRIGVSCSLENDIIGEHTWYSQRIPFDLTAGSGDQTLRITTGSRLTIARNTIVRGALIEVYGLLNLLGAEDGRCRVLPPQLTPSPGDWQGILLHPGSTALIKNTDIAYAHTAITSHGASLRLWDCAVRNCKYDAVRSTGNSETDIRRTAFSGHGRNAVRLESGSLTGMVVGCSFTTCSSYPIWSVAPAVKLLAGNNTYVNNPMPRIGVACAADPDLTTGTHSWLAQGDLPYDLTVDSGGTVLNIASGATLNLPASVHIISGGIHVKGTLNVSGLSHTPTRFTGPLPGHGSASGEWAGLNFAGGKGAVNGALITGATVGVACSGTASPRLAECRIEGNQQDGLQCLGSATPIITQSRIIANGRHGVFIDQSAKPNLGRVDNAATTDDGLNRIEGNGGYDLYNNTSGKIYAQNNWWASGQAALVQSRIFDQADMSHLGQVSVNPLRGATANRAPVLQWQGTAGYVQTGVNPVSGRASTIFKFRVRYTDADNNAPDHVRLHIARSGVEIASSPYDMVRGVVVDYVRGVNYFRNLRLPSGRDYTYWFSAHDGQAEAVGQPLTPQIGPLINAPPTITWTGEGGWANDGVHPNSGAAGSWFTFRCRYTDVDNNWPEEIRLHVLRSGSPIAGSPFALTLISDTIPRQGLIYEARVKLTNSGAHTYRFEATDGLASATGEGTVATGGLNVTSVAIAEITTLTATQTNSGTVELRWHLASAGRVTIRVLNVAGHVVAVPVNNSAAPAGAGLAHWSRRSLTQTRVPAGRYLVVMEAADETGYRCQSLTSLSLTTSRSE
jgi:hypothetical protein